MSTFRTVRMDASLDECYCNRLRYARVCGRRRKRPIILCGRSALSHPHLGADKERTTGPASTVPIPTMAAMHHPREIRLAIAMAPSTMTRQMAAGVSHPRPGAFPRR
jgi:hypothetical protein